MDVGARIGGYIGEKFDAVVADDTPLIAKGIIDSMGVMELVAFLEEAFGIEFEMDDLTMENMGTINSIKALVMRKREGA